MSDDELPLPPGTSLMSTMTPGDRVKADQNMATCKAIFASLVALQRQHLATHPEGRCEPPCTSPEFITLLRECDKPDVMAMVVSALAWDVARKAEQEGL